MFSKFLKCSIHCITLGTATLVALFVMVSAMGIVVKVEKSLTA